MFSVEAFAQVKIRERVEIAPRATKKHLPGLPMLSSQYLPCNEPQSDTTYPMTFRRAVWHADSFNGWIPLSSFGGGLPFVNTIVGSVTHGAQFVRLALNRDPDPLGGMVSGGSFYFRPAWGYDVIATFDQGSIQDSAIVGFQFQNIDTSSHYPFNICFAEVIVVKRKATFPYRSLVASLTHGEQINPLSDGIFYTVDQCGEGFLPPGVQYTATIVSGAQYGALENAATGERGQTITESDSTFVYRLRYIANGAEPESTSVTVGVRITSSDTTMDPVDLTIDVYPFVPPPEPDCLLLSFSPPQLAPGDTAAMIFRKQKPDGTIEEYPSGQLFFVEIEDGGEFGTLAASFWGSADTGDALLGEMETFTFIAAQGIEGDSAVVHMRAELAEIGGRPSGFPKGTESGSSGANRETRATAMQRVRQERMKRGGSGVRTSVTCPLSFSLPIQNHTDTLHHFALSIIPDTLGSKDTLAFTELAKLIVQAKDANDRDIEFDPNALVKFSVESNAQYGTFIKPNGDTVKTTPVVLDSVRYEDAKNGRVKFAAVKQNPDSVVRCNVRVALRTDATKKGDREAVVLEKTLKIVMETPYEVRPSIPTEDGDVAIVRLRTKPFEVRMTRGGKPVPNHPFRLRTDYVEFSGGHSHGDTREVRRPNNNDNYGFFLITQGGQQYRPLDESTNAQGTFAVNYSASIFGGTMRIYLKSRNNPLLLDSLSVEETVAGLVNFRNVPSNSRWIFAQGTEGATRHPDNNWCTQAFADSMQRAVEDFYDWTLSAEGGGAAIPVSLNDMSLPRGGRFDISARWNGRNSQAHLFHRVGTSVDVNQTLNNVQLSKLTRFMRRRGLERNAERPEIHYGSNGGN
jgi:hypothetical protein